MLKTWIGMIQYDACDDDKQLPWPELLCASGATSWTAALPPAAAEP
jgi:hypothetical protein